MSLTLYSHPLASFCWKALIALYEADIAFTAHLVDLGDADAAAAFRRISPMGKMPALRDAARDRTILESTIVVEYLALNYPSAAMLVPADPERAIEARMRDRFFDLYVQEPMQKIVLDRLRPEAKRDPHGVTLARAQLREAYDEIERFMAGKTWALGEAFTMADCAAAPALHYAELVEPFAPAHENTAHYLRRLKARPSVARVLAEAEPYSANFPREAP